MAVLNPIVLAAIRNRIERTDPSVPYTKDQINAAAQAIEDRFEAIRASMVTAVNTATAPLVLSPSVSNALIRFMILEKTTRNI